MSRSVAAITMVLIFLMFSFMMLHATMKGLNQRKVLEKRVMSWQKPVQSQERKDRI